MLLVGSADDAREQRGIRLVHIQPKKAVFVDAFAGCGEFEAHGTAPTILNTELLGTTWRWSTVAKVNFVEASPRQFSRSVDLPPTSDKCALGEL